MGRHPNYTADGSEVAEGTARLGEWQGRKRRLIVRRTRLTNQRQARLQG